MTSTQGQLTWILIVEDDQVNESKFLVSSATVSLNDSFIGNMGRPEHVVQFWVLTQVSMSPSSTWEQVWYFLCQGCLSPSCIPNAFYFFSTLYTQKQRRYPVLLTATCVCASTTWSKLAAFSIMLLMPTEASTLRWRLKLCVTQAAFVLARSCTRHFTFKPPHRKRNR